MDIDYSILSATKYRAAMLYRAATLYRGPTTLIDHPAINDYIPSYPHPVVPSYPRPVSLLPAVHAPAFPPFADFKLLLTDHSYSIAKGQFTFTSN